MSNDKKIFEIIEPVKRVLQGLKADWGINLQTLTPTQYDYHRESTMPLAKTIVKRAHASWEQILAMHSLPAAMTRGALANLGNLLHLLEKRIARELKVGWEERSFPVTDSHEKWTYRKMRPDACCMERLYLQENRLLILDVKLSIYSAPITIYKYLPLFKPDSASRVCKGQLTFFPAWIPETAHLPAPKSQVNRDGQMDMFLENDILFICYLLGSPARDLPPGSRIYLAIKNGRHKIHKGNWKRLPDNMEVRFVPFMDLPKLYSEIAGIDYDRTLQRKIGNVLKIAGFIKNLVLTNPPEADYFSESLYLLAKTEKDAPVEILLEKIRAFLRTAKIGK